MAAVETGSQRQPQPGSMSSLGAAGAATAGAGAALIATMATACCAPVAAPLIVALLGAGGAAWAAGLKPYSPYLLVGSFVLLAFGFWAVYRPRQSCAVQAGRSPGRLAVRLSLWVALLLWAASMLINFVLT